MVQDIPSTDGRTDELTAALPIGGATDESINPNIAPTIARAYTTRQPTMTHPPLPDLARTTTDCYHNMPQQSHGLLQLSSPAVGTVYIVGYGCELHVLGSRCSPCTVFAVAFFRFRKQAVTGRENGPSGSCVKSDGNLVQLIASTDRLIIEVSSGPPRGRRRTRVAGARRARAACPIRSFRTREFDRIEWLFRKSTSWEVECFGRVLPPPVRAHCARRRRTAVELYYYSFMAVNSILLHEAKPPQAPSIPYPNLIRVRYDLGSGAPARGL
ncbi:hypothetical protein EVAR_22580_1 [Eumeta japonica]|uniref:Uncharacterized protein n=1 Tax=Eumeta variegata TaxID=151549 RepID=A0A4C1U8N9_EUMVA|nr:hypothetical protein EVAR_22580_1 [Eumeta japonica]